MRATDKTPRKQAVQERSKRTLRAILDAAARVLKRDGPGRLTTNHIAEAANVSVGSVYQYFPNKQSIITSLMRAQLDRAMRLRPRELDRSESISLEEKIRTSVRWHLDVNREDPELFQRLFELQPEILTARERSQFDRFHEDAILQGLQHHRREITVKDLRVAALVVSKLLSAGTQAATAARRELLDDPQHEVRISEAILAYLQGRRCA